jgi:hypothetical protein
LPAAAPSSATAAAAVAEDPLAVATRAARRAQAPASRALAGGTNLDFLRGRQTTIKVKSSLLLKRK